MYSYEVWIRSQEYHGVKPLTYTSLNRLNAGAIVKVPLKNKSTMGIVRRAAVAPRGVAMKPIEGVYDDGSETIPTELLKLLGWILQYYPAGSGSITQLFLPNAWPNLVNLDGLTVPRLDKAKSLPDLTPEQNSAIEQIRKGGSYILHGETGSGKTRVYTDLIYDSLSKGRSSIVLVPEIGLTPHLTEQLNKAFDPRLIKVVHSGLTPLKRKQVWAEILSAKHPLIVIGPRSALFSPLHNIGLIIADECHDNGYKQESAPYYHGLRVAAQLAHLHDATLVFGSATPSITDIYIATGKDVPIVRMEKNAKDQKKNTLKPLVINKRDKVEFTKSPILSSSLLELVAQQLQKGQQSLMFLNRRGSARVIACSKCGWRSLCPNCELPLTLHEDTFSTRCHTCGFKGTPPTQCPECNNLDIVFFGPGTKALEKELNKLFSNASVIRFDGDNLTHEKLDKHLERIQNGDIDIIIGTQILVKGFDIPKLGLVGIIDADASLSFPDFSTEENTYQLISQAMGRVGRGHVEGHIVVQTIEPDSPILQQAIRRDWEQFYQTQLAMRQAHNFPPFTFLLKLECSRKQRKSAENAAEKLKTILEEKNAKITILGPTPSFREKNQNGYTWQLVIKSPLRSELLKIIHDLPSGWKYDIDPTHLL